MRALHGGLLRVLLALCSCVGAMVLAASQAAAQTPSVGVWTYRGPDLWNSAGAIDATTTIYGSRHLGFFGSVANAPVALSGRITVPGGFSYLSMEQPMYIGWDGATDTLTLSTPGEVAPGDDVIISIDLPFSRVSYQPGVYAPPIGATRAMGNPVLTADVQTRSLALTLDIPAGSLSGYDSLSVFLPDYSQADGVAATVTGAPLVAPSFAWGGGNALYATAAPGSLAGAYAFDLDVEFTRVGEVSQAQMGNLYYTPAVYVLYAREVGSSSSTPTSLELDLGDGFAATFEAPEIVSFQSHGNSYRPMMIFDFVAAAADAPAQPEHIAVGVGRTTSITGLETFEFWCEVEGANIVGGAVTTPGSQTYEIMLDEGDQLECSIESTVPGDLSEFTPGTYIVEVRGSDGNSQTYSIDLTGGMPSQRPIFDQPPGFETPERRPTVSWADPTDPNVSHCVFEIMQHEGDVGYEEDDVWLDPIQDDMEYTPTEDLVNGGVIVSAAFADVVTGTVDAAEGTMLDVSFTAGYFRGVDSYMNVIPEPATLSLLALGGLALLRRRRG